MTNEMWVVALVGVGTILVNLCIFALNLKLYTEFFKERVKNGPNKKMEVN